MSIVVDVNQGGAGFGCFRSRFNAYLKERCEANGIVHLVASPPLGMIPPNGHRRQYACALEKATAIWWLGSIARSAWLPFEQATDAAVVKPPWQYCFCSITEVTDDDRYCVLSMSLW